ncbi:MAG: helix-turn-helix transcriptional regulator [Proteobacteria bacterium]|nr:helix-turn-helix transcriptional regulator [Pseudomonadota bacterium]
MGRKRFGDMNCGIAQALEALGDWWTLLIVRDAFFGARRFGEFERNLGIAKNILTARLRRLVEHGVLERSAAGTTGDRHEYHLTPKGQALLPVLVALREWSDEWVFGRGHEPLILRERSTGRRLPRLRVTNRDGKELKMVDISAAPGPGASAETRSRLERRAASET